jgi:hypothetical protein
MGHQIQYSVTNTGLLKDVCEHTGHLIGGYYCVNCKHFSHKCIKSSFVVCSMKHTKK